MGESARGAFYCDRQVEKHAVSCGVPGQDPGENFAVTSADICNPFCSGEIVCARHALRRDPRRLDCHPIEDGGRGRIVLEVLESLCPKEMLARAFARPDAVQKVASHGP